MENIEMMSYDLYYGYYHFNYRVYCFKHYLITFSLIYFFFILFYFLSLDEKTKEKRNYIS